MTGSVGVVVVVEDSASRFGAELQFGGLDLAGGTSMCRGTASDEPAADLNVSVAASWSTAVKIPLSFSGSNAKIHDPGQDASRRGWVKVLPLSGAPSHTPKSLHLQPAPTEAPTPTSRTRPLFVHLPRPLPPNATPPSSSHRTNTHASWRFDSIARPSITRHSKVRPDPWMLDWRLDLAQLSWFRRDRR